MVICPRSGTRTFLDTRLAVGRFLQSSGYGPAQLTIPATVSHRMNACKMPCVIELTEDGYWKNEEEVDEEELHHVISIRQLLECKGVS